MDYPDVASLAIPSALLVINGRRDGLFNLDGVHSAFAKLGLLQKAGMMDRFRAAVRHARTNSKPRNAGGSLGMVATAGSELLQEPVLLHHSRR